MNERVSENETMHPLLTLPFDLLVQALHRQGFILGIDTLEAMHFVIQQAVACEQTEKLPFMLCPVFAHTAEQQALFMEIYRNTMLPAVPENEDLPPANQESPEENTDSQPTENSRTPAKEALSEKSKEIRKKIVASLKASPSNARLIQRFPQMVSPVDEAVWIKQVRLFRYTRPTKRLVPDIPKTIKRTIHNFGNTQIQWSTHRRHAEYIMLIDRNNERDHAAAWHNHFYSLLLANNIQATRYYFDHNPQVLYSEKQSSGIALSEIIHRFSHAFLFVFADGSQFVNAATRQLFTWSTDLLVFPFRILMSSLSPAFWGKREAQLAQVFQLIIPFNQNGLQAVNEYISGNAPAEHFAAWYWQSMTTEALSAIDTTEADMRELEFYYSPDLLRWIAACAIYPELNWNLTLALGEFLSRGQKPLHTHAHIAQLNRLDWFTLGYMPDAARLRLIKNWLTKTDAAAIHRFLYEQLSQQKPTEDQPGCETYMLQLAIHDLLGETDKTLFEQKANQLHVQTEKKIRLRDLVNIRLINEHELSHVDFEIPESWLKKMGLENLLTHTFQSFTESATGVPFAMVAIKGGTFTMGSPENEVDRGSYETQHPVKLSDFYMSATEVSQGLYKAVMGKNESRFKGDDLPVESVSWYDAIEFCNALSQKAGLQPYYTIDKNKKDPNNTNSSDDIKWTVSINQSANGYRLPTEAEWEYAARAGTSTPFHTGHNLTTAQANYNGNYPYNGNAKGEYRAKTVAVKSFVPNAWGLYNMHGNVWEWCWDWYGTYPADISENPTGYISGDYRVVRGGGWYSSAHNCRSAYRSRYWPDRRDSYIGFRLCRNY